MNILSLKSLLLCIIFILLSPLNIYADRDHKNEMPIEEMAKKKLHHGKNGRFENPWCDDCRKSFLDFLKWQFSSNKYSAQKDKHTHVPFEKPDIKALEATGKDWFVWLGHSTLLMRVGGKYLITDPIFEGATIFFDRMTPLSIDIDDLPKIDYILISHGHYDHLDTDTLQLLNKKFKPQVISGPGYEEYFSGIDIKNTILLDWWESYNDGELKITSLPAQHWSKRTLFDSYSMLWCSFIIEKEEKRYYWLGDGGYFRGFAEIGEKFGPFDIAFLPIGAYEPRWFMKSHHMNPDEALMAAWELKAKMMIPIHWGTFDLTDEPLDLPPELVEQKHYGFRKDFELKMLPVGGSYMNSRE
ncbi:MAG: MBL fold metallo-hydrolase [Deltaproteobacteria bacterium]|nr:MBL fold metallo-hydrolase [Deltaproteobacteria bacterium]